MAFVIKSVSTARKIRVGRALPVRSEPVDVEPLVDLVRQHVALKPAVLNHLRMSFRKALVDQSIRAAEHPQVAKPTLVPEGDQVLSTQQAADLVGVSRPFMAARIDAGDIPLFQQVGNQRRVLRSAVHAWHEETRDKARQAMSALGRSIDDEYLDKD